MKAMPKTALLLIILGCAIPSWFYLGAFPWSQSTKMASACLGMALALTGLVLLVGEE